MVLGDEAYGTNWGYPQLLEAFERTFGISQQEWEVFIFHQGRAAEHALFSQLKSFVGEGSIIPSNGHFDTTHANIQSNGMEARNLFSAELREGTAATFAGNMDTTALEQLLAQQADRVPLVYATVTNNTGGGQPVSLQNLEQIRQIAQQYNKPFFLDACRFAENAWFMKTRDPALHDRSVLSIVHAMFSLCDGFTISLKKDGLANMGGALVVRKDSPLIRKFPDMLNCLRDHQILTEGHPTYGGLSGRDILCITEGLKTVVTPEYLESRIKLVGQFGSALASYGIPIVQPIGGHAVYIDVDHFFEGTAFKREDFGGIALTALLLLKGVRLCELGAFAFGRWNPQTSREEFLGKNYVRAAIPRNKYEAEDLLYVADCVKGLYERRDQIPRAVPISGREMSLRHFKAAFSLESIV